MKPVLCYLVLLSVLYSCKTAVKKDRALVHPDFDSICDKALNRADSDIAAGIWHFCYNGRPLYISGLRSHRELDSLLRDNNINPDYEYRDAELFALEPPLSGELAGREKAQRHCYCDYMHLQIDKKHGGYFIDSLIQITDSLFAILSTNDTLSLALDTQPCYPGDTPQVQPGINASSLQYDIDGALVYPKGYSKRKSNNDDAYSDMDFVVDQQGRATLTRISFTYTNAANTRFNRYFERIIRRSFKKNGWTAGTIRNQKAISTISLKVYFD